MLQAIKIKLYPTDEQKNYINQLIGCNRFIYNQCLNYKINEYQTNKKSTGLTDTNNHVKSLKNNYLWINESHSKVIQQTLINLETAYTNFFRDLKKTNNTGFPNYKKKSNPMNVRFPADAFFGSRSKTGVRCINGNRISIITKLKDIHYKCSRIDEIVLNKCQKSIKSGTLSKDKTGDYYFSILIDRPTKSLNKPDNEIVGIDLGIKEFVITSEGQLYENLHFNKRQTKKLARYQRSLSRKQNKSSNKEKS